jgi:hypothetical protein
MDDESNVCPTCKGKCCRDTDYGYRVVHMGAEVYMHDCEYCKDGNVPQPDPRDATLAHLTSELAERHAENIEWANASLVTDERIHRAIDLCEWILSCTGPDEATTQERALARSVLIALKGD